MLLYFIKGEYNDVKCSLFKGYYYIIMLIEMCRPSHYLPLEKYSLDLYLQCLSQSVLTNLLSCDPRRLRLAPMQPG